LKGIRKEKKMARREKERKGWKGIKKNSRTKRGLRKGRKNNQMEKRAVISAGILNF
jgi:hypothetical protein